VTYQLGVNFGIIIDKMMKDVGEDVIGDGDRGIEEGEIVILNVIEIGQDVLLLKDVKMLVGIHLIIIMLVMAVQEVVAEMG